MYHVRQVLIPVDFSTFSRCAVAFAAKLGKDSEYVGEDTKLQLVHAVSELPAHMRAVLFPYAGLGEDDREFEAEIAQITRRRLAEYFAIDEKLEARFVDEPQIAFGCEKQRISRWMSRFDADLVAAGAFGEHGVFAGGPGSTSRRLVSASTRPVALIRDYDPNVTVDAILVALDLGRSCGEVLEVAMALAVALDARLEALHVIPSPFMDDTNWMVEREFDVDADRLEETLRPRADALMDEIVDGVDVPMAVRKPIDELMQGWSIRFGEPASEIGDAVGEGQFDMVVMGRGGGNTPGPGRVASAVMADVARHLVVVPQ